MFEVELAKLGFPILERLGGSGMEVEIVDDYRLVEARVAEVGRLNTIPMMDVSRLDFEEGEAFWAFLKKDGRCVASVSAKLIDLRSETLGTYTRRTTIGQYNRQHDPIRKLDPIFDVIRGQVVYTGQVQTEEKKPGTSNVGMADLVGFLRFVQLVILNRWRFDWMFGYVDHKHLPLNRFYGFSCTIRDAIQWHEPPPRGRNSGQILLASSRRQVEIFVRLVRRDKLCHDDGSLSTAVANGASSGA